VDTCRPAVRAVRPQLAEGRIGLAPSSVRQMMPGAQASATTVRATIAAIRRSPRPDARHSRPANDERGLRTQARSGGRSVWNLLPLIPRRSAATSATIADVIVEFMNDDKGQVRRSWRPLAVQDESVWMLRKPSDIAIVVVHELNDHAPDCVTSGDEPQPT